MAMIPPAEFRASKIEELLSSGNQPANAPSGSPRQAGQSGADCPPEECWRKVSSHEMDETESSRLIEHAAECRFCGPRLHYWASVFADEETAEESVFFSQLSASKSGWRERMAKELIEKGSSPRPPATFARNFFLPTALGFAGALAAALIVFLVVKGFHPQPAPERLLAEAYTGQRIMDARIPLAAYAPVSPPHHQRAAGTSSMSDSVPLLEARAAITQALLKKPEDPHLLLLQARADLLSEDYTTAIDTLKRIVAQSPANVEALSDLAAAYSMRATATDVVSDRATALDYLEQAARLDPKNPVILYNEAVVLQNLYQYNNAIEAWKKFLAVEHDRRWIEDGKHRLAGAEAREAQLKAQQGRLDPFLSTPEGMLHLARSPALLADYDEELSTVHLPLLLKTAFPQAPTTSQQASATQFPPHSIPENCTASCTAARTLLGAIARSLEVHHQDKWLSDFLRSPATPDFVTGTNLLADAVDGGLRSDDATALRQGLAAASYFHHAGDTAGELRAGVERIHSFQRLLDAPRCLADSAKIESILARKQYTWIAAEFWADVSNCYWDISDFATEEATLNRSLRITEATQYRIANMRALSFVAVDAENLGNYTRAWTLNMEGLRRFWAGNYPAIRGHQFYINLAYTEGDTARAYSSVLIHQEALAFISPLQQPSTAIADRFLLVKAQIRAGEMREAATQLQLAEAEFANLPSQETFRNNAADCHIMLAQAYLARGDAASAAAMLTDASGLLPGSPDQYLLLRYSEALGHLALIQNNRVQAEARLTEAISAAEQEYESLHTISERIGWIRQARETYAALTLLRLREGTDPIEALSIWERYRVLSAGAPLSRWCSGKEITCLAQPLDAARKTLRQETVLGSLRLDRSLVLWSMDDRGIHIQELGIDADRFDLLSRTFAETVATPQSSEASILFYGRRLADMLLLPLSQSLDTNRTLVFDLDDSVEFLPVAALPLHAGYLGTQFSISTVHSLLAAGHEQSSNASPAALVIGASLPGDPDAVPLPEAKAEALAVAPLLSHARVLTGDEATPGAVRSAIARSVLIHFAGHTRSFAGQTTLVLARNPSSHAAQDAWLDLSALQAASLKNCQLIVLSACSTGKREEREADDSSDIVQSLAAAGVPDIVATHWDVDSAAAVPLMQRFYSGLAQGLTVPQALSRAETAVETSAEYHHPFYWAAYYAIGLGKAQFRELIHE